MIIFLQKLKYSGASDLHTGRKEQHEILTKLDWYIKISAWYMCHI